MVAAIWEEANEKRSRDAEAGNSKLDKRVAERGSGG